MAEDKKPIEEYLNLSIMNQTKAIENMADQVKILAGIIEKVNWNLGSMVKLEKEKLERK